MRVFCFVDSQRQYWSFKKDYKDVILFFKIGVSASGFNINGMASCSLADRTPAATSHVTESEANHVPFLGIVKKSLL